MLKEQDDDQEREPDAEGLPVELLRMVGNGANHRLDVGLVGEGDITEPVLQLGHADCHGRARHEAHDGGVAQELNDEAQPGRTFNDDFREQNREVRNQSSVTKSDESRQRKSFRGKRLSMETVRCKIQADSGSE